MHELGMLRQAAELATKCADENGVDEVQSIAIEVGELSGALPYVFTEYFPLIAEKYPKVRNAKLNLRTIPGEGLCCQCKCLFNVMKQEGVCPRCGSREKKILGGQEVRILNITY